MSFSFRNGSRIIAGHFQNEKDIDAYLGLEYDVIGIEEATTLTARKYQDITTCCRTSKPNWRPRIYSTTNPGGVGHGWYRKRFIEPWQRHAETETRFVAARVTDNRWNNPEYMRVLEGLTGWQRRAWLDGDWDIAAGQFFTTLRREVHIVSDFDETRAREWICALDYGFTHYTVVLLGCTDGDGNLFVVDDRAAAEASELASVSEARPGDALAGVPACLAGFHVVERSGVGGRHREPPLGAVPPLLVASAARWWEREGAWPTGA